MTQRNLELGSLELGNFEFQFGVEYHPQGMRVITLVAHTYHSLVANIIAEYKTLHSLDNSRSGMSMPMFKSRQKFQIKSPFFFIINQSSLAVILHHPYCKHPDFSPNSTHRI